MGCFRVGRWALNSIFAVAARRLLRLFQHLQRSIDRVTQVQCRDRTTSKAAARDELGFDAFSPRQKVKA
jgi:hypothetical protein